MKNITIDEIVIQNILITNWIEEPLVKDGKDSKDISKG